MGLLVMSKQFNSRKEMEADARREDRALSRSKSKALTKKKIPISPSSLRNNAELKRQEQRIHAKYNK